MRWRRSGKRPNRPRPDPLTGPLLAALLGAPIVQRQIRSKQFTADIIDSIVGRLQEVVLPIPRDKVRREEIAERCADIYDERAEARSRTSRISSRLYLSTPARSA